jgi:hypothetical protein
VTPLIDGLGRAAPFLLIAVLSLALRALLPRTARRPFPLLRELLLILPVVVLYFIAHGLAQVRPQEATAHAEQIVSLERALGIFHEPQFQRFVLRRTLLVDLANWNYMWGHWPVLIATLVWLGYRHPNRLVRYRNALILSGVIGIGIFLVYPVAPPRFLTSFGFVDTIALRSHAYRALEPPAFTDVYASMPSLHVGWNLLMGIALAREATRPAARWFGRLMPIAMYATVVVTANHYFVDGVVGAAIVVVSLVAATRSSGRSSSSPS